MFVLGKKYLNFFKAKNDDLVYKTFSLRMSQQTKQFNIFKNSFEK